jgi:hypothetical protein
MKLSQLAREPQLIKLTLDDEDIVAEYGEAVEFWTWDRQPMNTFMKLAAVDAADTGSIFGAVRELVLDESGKPVLSGTATLPTQVMLRVIARVVEGLGK